MIVLSKKPQNKKRSVNCYVAVIHKQNRICIRRANCNQTYYN